MKKKQLISLLSAFLALCLSLPARGQTSITIVGDDPVCVKTLHTYSVSSPTTGIFYFWSVNIKGNINTTTTTSADVFWGSAGTGTVKVYGTDANGDTVEAGTKNVTISASPTPFITTDFRVACQKLGYTDTGAVVDFDTSKCFRVCAFNCIVFHAKGAAGSTFSWSATGGSGITPMGANNDSAKICWSGPGFGTVTVEETNTAGCIGRRSYCVEVMESPIAHLVSMPDTNLNSIVICDSTEVVFINKSVSSASSPIVAWYWDFGDNTYYTSNGSSSAPVTHMYNLASGIPSDVIATLTVINACGCSTTDTIWIHIDPHVRVKIECPRVVCEGDTITYSADPICASGTWKVIGGSTYGATPASVNVIWNAPPADGMGYVTYDATGCGNACDVTTVKVPIVMQGGNIDGPLVVCPYSQAVYFLPQWPTTYFSFLLMPGAPTGTYLTPSDQTNEIILNTTTAGTALIRAEYFNSLLGCTDIVFLSVTIADPVVLAGADKVCLNQNSTYTVTGVGASSGSWVLTYPDASTQTSSGLSGTWLFDQTGTYILTVTGSFCPPAPLMIQVDALPPIPDDIVGPDTFCKGVPVRFDGANNLDGTIFNWTVLNGTANATAGTPTYITLNPASGGPFVIYLWRELKDAPFCHSDTLTDTVYAPVVNLSVTGPTVVCASHADHYSATYVDGETYEWKVVTPDKGSVIAGDGTPNVNILWNNSLGTAKVACHVRKCFTDYYDTLTVTIGGIPTAVLTAPSTVCEGTPFNVSVSNTSTAVWNFGDNLINYSNGGASYTYTYSNIDPALNPFTITVLASLSGCSATQTLTQAITVNPAPSGLVAPNIVLACGSVSQNLVYTQTATGTTPPLTYQWYFDGSVITGATASNYTATAFGAYWVVVTDALGCTWTSDSIKALDNCPCTFPNITPSVAITSATLTGCDGVSLTSSHTSPGFVSYSWQLPPSFTSVSTGTTASATGTKSGIFTIKYSALYTDVNTCELSDYTYVLVPYIANVGYDFTCSASGGDREVNIYPLADAFIPPDYYELYVDGVLIGTGSSPVTYNGYLSVGTHTAKVVIGATGYANCDKTISFNVGWPHANFRTSRPITCELEAPVLFTNTSTNAGSPPKSLWDFGDGTQNIQANPGRVYNSGASPYNVFLKVTDRYGCSDSIRKNVATITDQLKGSITPTPPDPCEGQPSYLDYLPNTSYFYPDQYTWYDNNVVFAKTIYEPLKVFKSGYYWEHGDDQYGCVDNTTAVVVDVSQVPPAYVSGDVDQCENVSFTLSGYAGSDPNIQYQWLLNGTPITGATSPTLTQLFTSTATPKYKIIITVPKVGTPGVFCSDTSDEFAVVVHGIPVPPSISFNILDCNKYEVELTGTHSSGATETFNWSNGLYGSPAYTYNGGSYQLTFTDQFGCISKDTIYIPKDPRAYLWTFPTGCWSICPPNTYTITGPQNMPFWPWDYNKNGGSIFSGMGKPTDYTNLGTDAPGVFTMSLNNGYCSATSGDMIVDVNCNPQHLKPNNPTEIQKFAANKAVLDIVPNPAGNNTRIRYNFADNEGKHVIEIYDMLGRLVSSIQAPQAFGVWQLSLDRFSPGIYQVVMKQNGNVIKQDKLSVAK